VYHLLISDVSQDVLRLTQLALQPRMLLFPELSGPSFQQMLSMLDVHLLSNLVPLSKEDIGMLHPAQALAESLALTYP
jgi:hypothetical protein